MKRILVFLLSAVSFSFAVPLDQLLREIGGKVMVTELKEIDFKNNKKLSQKPVKPVLKAEKKKPVSKTNQRKIKSVFIGTINGCQLYFREGNYFCRRKK